MSLERVPEGERRGEDAQRQVREGQRRDERVARVHAQLPAKERCGTSFYHQTHEVSFKAGMRKLILNCSLRGGSTQLMHLLTRYRVL